MMQNYQSNNQQPQFYGAPIRQQFAQQLRNATKAEKHVEVKLTHAQNEKAFYLENVENAFDLNINAPNLKYQITRTNGTNNYKVQYFPTGGEHTVGVKYAGAHVDGSPFLLAPTPPKIVFNHDEGVFSVENIHDVEKLQINSETLPYEMFRDKETHTKYHVKYESGQQIHDVDVVYDDTPVENGLFRLVPKEMKEAYMREQEQQTLSENTEPLDGELLWEHTPGKVNAQQSMVMSSPTPPRGELVMEHIPQQPMVMTNYEMDEDLIYEHIPQQSGARVTPTLYQPPPQSRNGAFY